jgi:GT2 family glycosyltransferase
MSRKKSRARRRTSRTQVKRPASLASPHLIDILMPVFGEFTMAAQSINRVPIAAASLGEDRIRIIIIDNGTPVWISNDSKRELSPKEQAKPVLEALRSQDQFIRLEKNVGYPGAINFAASKGKSPLILILTPDVFLEPGCIEEMVREMDDPMTGIASPKLLFPTDRESPRGPAGTVQHAGLAFNIRGNPFHIFIGWSPDHPKVNVRREMSAVTGACFMTRRALFEDIGGFDEKYGAGTFEDVDYCFAVRSRNLNVIYQPKAVAFHLVGGSMLEGANRHGFNLPVNETRFRGRWAEMLAWDEWRYF